METPAMTYPKVDFLSPESADAARPQGKILPSLAFDKLFEAELPTLVAPDAP